MNKSAKLILTDEHWYKSLYHPERNTADCRI